LTIRIKDAILQKACMEMIETIFFCLPNAFKGTIYRVGKMPDLIVERITSGEIKDGRASISWGLHSSSGYAPPGRSWHEYRDEPGRPLEAMGWCVERQKSWTAANPSTDARSVRLQTEGDPEDFQHLEPVLVRKSDLNLDMYSSSDFPKNYAGETIWQETEYIVVAVVKIHFRPDTIKMNSDETRVIKKLSRSLGTELLSYKLRQDSVNALQNIARDRLNACDILSDSLRNAIAKSAHIISLIKQEINNLRERWEGLLLEERNETNIKEEVIKRLNSLLASAEGGNDDMRKRLENAHNKFLSMSLPPELGTQWIEMQIEDRWWDFLAGFPKADEGKREQVMEEINKLKRSLHYGREPEIIDDYNKIPYDIKKEWVELIYKERDGFDGAALEKVIAILGEPSFNIPYKERSRKALIQLKVLGETMSQLERNTNFLLHQVLNGKGAKKEIENLSNVN
jgi:hypothetical protein